jgi:hypothetical protein
MRVIESPSQLIFESRSISARTWLVWGLLFAPGLVALVLLPEANRLIGLLVWMAIWLASIFLLPRWVGDRVQVCVDSKARTVSWRRNNQVTREVGFGEIKGFEIKQISIATRPYKAFQLVALLRNNSQITLAVDPRDSQLQNCLLLTRKYLR